MMPFIICLMILIPLLITGCSGNGGGAGHWFHILFIIIPAGIYLYMINKKLDALQDFVSKQADTISNLSARIDKDKKAGK